MATALAVVRHDTGTRQVARWDGKLIRRLNGRLLITQRLLWQHQHAKARLERLHALVASALAKGASVEVKSLDAGLFTEMSRDPNWREEFVRLGGDPKAVLKRTPQEESRPRLRIWVVGGKRPGGRQVAPKR